MATATKTKRKATRPPAKDKKKKAPTPTFSDAEADASTSTAKGKKKVSAKTSSTKTKATTTVKPKTDDKKTAAKTSGKKATSSKKTGGNGQRLPRVLNEHGFVVGSDSEKIVEILLKGGADRRDINAKVAKAIGNRKTRSGNDQNVSSLIANVLKRLHEKGYKVDSSWVLVPPTPEERAKAERRAKRAASKAKATKKA